MSCNFYLGRYPDLPLCFWRPVRSRIGSVWRAGRRHEKIRGGIWTAWKLVQSGQESKLITACPSWGREFVSRIDTRALGMMVGVVGVQHHQKGMVYKRYSRIWQQSIPVLNKSECISDRSNLQKSWIDDPCPEVVPAVSGGPRRIAHPCNSRIRNNVTSERNT